MKYPSPLPECDMVTPYRQPQLTNDLHPEYFCSLYYLGSFVYYVQKYLYLFLFNSFSPATIYLSLPIPPYLSLSTHRFSSYDLTQVKLVHTGEERDTGRF